MPGRERADACAATIRTMNTLFFRSTGAGRHLRGTALAWAVAALSCPAALAQSVTVQDAWARATVPGQRATGAFMRLRAASGTRLQSASTPAAAVAELHEMRMEGNIMRMQALKDGLDLPAGQTVELKRGGYHLMLLDLKAPLRSGSTVALTLVFVDAKGVQSTSEIQLPVSTVAPPPSGH
jgi:copper(I)-binding protein